MNRFSGILKRLSQYLKSKRPIGQISKGEIRPTGRLVAHKLPKNLKIQVNDEVAIKDRFGLHQTGAGKEAVRIANSEGQTAAADLGVDGSINLSIEGDSRQGESGTIDVCRILVRRLNQEGTSWADPIDLTEKTDRFEEGVDCEAHDNGNLLKIQVTRVERDIWRDLSKNKKASKRSDVDSIIEVIRNVILAKTKPIPVDQRKELVLALDATETPAYALEVVTGAFRDKYTDAVAQLGYQGVWMVGPEETLTFRLDSRE